jgi:hypothetical protein
MWKPSHEWRLEEATPSSRGYSVEPQNQGRRLNKEVWPPRAVQPPMRDSQTAWASLTAQVAATENLRSGGHASRSQGLRQG